MLIIVFDGSMTCWKGELEYWIGDTDQAVICCGQSGAHQSDRMLEISQNKCLKSTSDVSQHMQTVRKEFKPTVPTLIIVSNSSMTYWKGELEYWIGDTDQVVIYSGPPGARQQIAAHEFWLQPGALDGKTWGRDAQLQQRVPKPHYVLVSMESMIQVCSVIFVF
jgi:hypothetical protein